MAPEMSREADRRGVKLVVVPTPDAIVLLKNLPNTNAILHLTC